MRSKPWFQAGWPPVAAVFLFLLLWEGAVALWAIPGWILPGPIHIVQEGLSSAGRLWNHTASTIRIALLGFGVGLSFGLALSFLLHLFPRVKAAIYPLMILSQNIPTIALAPLLMIWFGFGLLPKIIVITLVCFFPVAVATLDGFMQTDRTMLGYMRMIGATRWQIFFKLELPHALPSMFSGMKISATYSIMSAVIAEWLGSDKGIGVYMLLAKSAFRTDRVFVAIFLVVALSLCLFGIIVLLERWLVRWKPKAKK